MGAVNAVALSSGLSPPDAAGTEVVEAVEGFGAVHPSFGLRLPDGWVGGRPFDEVFSLAEVRAGSVAVLVELSPGALLVLVRPGAPEVVDGELQIAAAAVALCLDRVTGAAVRAPGSGPIAFVPLPFGLA